MSQAVENLKKARELASRVRPKVGGFPYLAEAFRLSGVIRNSWLLPSCQSIFFTKEGAVVSQGSPLFTGETCIPNFNQEALIKALRIDQSGESTFLEFLNAAWEAGVVSYDVNFDMRTVTYYGAFGESYIEDYPFVEVKEQA